MEKGRLRFTDCSRMLLTAETLPRAPPNLDQENGWMDARELHYDNLSQLELGRFFPSCHSPVLLSHCPLLPMSGEGESSSLGMQTGNCEWKKGEAKVRWATKAQCLSGDPAGRPRFRGQSLGRKSSPEKKINFLLQGERSFSITSAGSSWGVLRAWWPDLGGWSLRRQPYLSEWGSESTTAYA